MTARAQAVKNSHIEDDLIWIFKNDVFYDTCSQGYYCQTDICVFADDQVHAGPSPVALMKAIKTEAEKAGMRACHLRDAVAVTQYLMWLEDTLAEGTATVTEYSGAAKLESFRRGLDGFVSPSFDTISSIGSNGAVIHYKPKEHDCRAITATDVYLCDSGGQYVDGTTDITRTVHFGTPTHYERRCWTRVLQSHISIDTAVFPANITTGYGNGVAWW
jgi:Xaa-Pro aminopeptidase